MPRIVAQILLAGLGLPLAAGVFVATMLVSISLFGSGPSPRTHVFGASSAATVFVVAYWLAIWSRHVAWTRRRMTGTIGAGVGAVVAGAGVAMLVHRLGPEMTEFSGFVTGDLVWVFLTILIWRETPGERAARLRAGGPNTVACPGCGYNLTGLSTTTCPECGTGYTLDQLLSANRDSGDTGFLET